MRSGTGRMVMPLLAVCVLLSSALFALAKQDAAKPDESRLKPAYRFERNHWIYVHLEGSPADIGYQHGYLLAPEIEDGVNTVRVITTHSTKRDWNFYRNTAQNVLWKHIDAEYQQELQGIVDGLHAHGVNLDRVGRGGVERHGRTSRLLRSLAEQTGKAGGRAGLEGAGKLQRAGCDRLDDHGPQAGHCP